MSHINHIMYLCTAGCAYAAVTLNATHTSTAHWSTANLRIRILDLNLKHSNDNESNVGWVGVKTTRECMDLQHMEHARDTARWHTWLEVIEQTSNKRGQTLNLIYRKDTIRANKLVWEIERENRQTKSENYRWEPIKYCRGARRRTKRTCTSTRTQLVDMFKRQSMAIKILKKIFR